MHRISFFCFSQTLFQNTFQFIRTQIQFSQIIIRPQLHCLLYNIEFFLAAYHDYSGFHFFFLQKFQNFQPADSGDIQIKKNDIRTAVPDHFQCFFSICCIRQQFQIQFLPVYKLTQSKSCQNFILYDQYLFHRMFFPSSG